jgi:hypothetical protein
MEQKNINNYPKTIVFFYSKFSTFCNKTISYFQKHQELDFINKVCVDSKSIREIIRKDKQLP